jgi:hypothetical protein
MSHLTLEALARLVDESPDDRERVHLARCAECAGELEALVEQRSLMTALPDLAPPPDAWPRLRAQLRREGLLHQRHRVTQTWARAAAAALLFLGGGVLGYAVRGQTDAGMGVEHAARAGEDVRAGRTSEVALLEPEPALDVEEAGERFMDALDRYMASAGAGPSDPATRLAALDNIVLTTAEALNEAPSDPIINGYHLSALAQRNAVLRQLATGSPDPIF